MTYIKIRELKSEHQIREVDSSVKRLTKIIVWFPRPQ